MEQNVTSGRIVEFFPGKETQYTLPNGMVSAPAIVTQVFGPHINLTIFISNPDGPPFIQGWSIPHKSDIPEESLATLFYWDWPQRT